MTKKVLVTGAGGFIGGFIVEEALRRGYDVWAAVRATTSREFLKDSRINFVELDFTDGDKFKSTIEAQLRQHGAWDYVVHNLGATKCVNFNDFGYHPRYDLRQGLEETIRWYRDNGWL